MFSVVLTLKILCKNIADIINNKKPYKQPIASGLIKKYPMIQPIINVPIRSNDANGPILELCTPSFGFPKESLYCDKSIYIIKLK